MVRQILCCCFSGLDPSFSILKTKALRFGSWLCSRLQVKLPILLVQGFGLAPSIGPNRIGSFTWRWEQSQLPKRSAFVFRILNDGSSPEKQQHRRVLLHINVSVCIIYSMKMYSLVYSVLEGMVFNSHSLQPQCYKVIYRQKTINTLLVSWLRMGVTSSRRSKRTVQTS
jgi:hypothetical protein